MLVILKLEGISPSFFQDAFSDTQGATDTTSLLSPMLRQG